jgi:hypothetical protein
VQETISKPSTLTPAFYRCLVVPACVACQLLPLPSAGNLSAAAAFAVAFLGDVLDVAAHVVVVTGLLHTHFQVRVSFGGGGMCKGSQCCCTAHDGGEAAAAMWAFER